MLVPHAHFSLYPCSQYAVHSITFLINRLTSGAVSFHSLLHSTRSMLYLRVRSSVATDMPFVHPVSYYKLGPVHLLSCLVGMPRRRKNRTHLKGIRSQESSTANVPKSFVIKHGHVGTSLTQLTRDIRKVMEPNTATRLKVCPCCL
jgi:hypothetical protein